MMFSSGLLRQFNHNQVISLQCLVASPYYRHLANLCANASSSTSNLQSSCGLFTDGTTKRIPSCSTEKVGNIVNFLRDYGLTTDQMEIMISLRPRLLVADAVNTLKPNLELFASLKISGTELVKITTKYPRVLESKANKLVELLQEYEFSNEEISVVTKTKPSLFRLKPDTNLRPKLDYLKSSGFSNLQIRKLVSSYPIVLKYSLQRRIMPAVAILTRYLGDAVKQKCQLFYHSVATPSQSLKKLLEGRIELLQSHGIPIPLIRKLILYTSRTLFISEEKLKKVLEEVTILSFKLTSSIVVEYIRIMLTANKETLDRRANLYRTFGLSEEDILAVLKKQPKLLEISEENIRESLGFFINRLKLSPSFISTYPCAVMYSMKNRILPRCAVIEILANKRFIKIMKFGTLMTYSETMFAGRFIEKYKEDAPEIVIAYKGQIPFNEFPDWYKLF